MKLETLKSDLFQALTTSEAAMIKGGLAEAAGETSSTVWSNTFVNGQYIGNDKDIFTDPAPTAPAPKSDTLIA